MKGTKKWYNLMKEFGFIQGEDGKDVLVHSVALLIGITISENDLVEYEIKAVERELRAINVTTC